MNKKKIARLHIGAGDIYLDGYTNLDIKGKLVSEVPTEKLEANRTTLSHYFKYPFGSPRRDVIVDKKQNLLERWDFEDNSVEEIVAISVMEHVFPDDAKFIVSEVKRVLKSQGIFIADFPNIEETVLQYIHKDPHLAMRLIYCHGRDIYSLHRNGFTFETFKELLGDGWDSVTQDTIVAHSYPMTGIIAIKK